MPYDTALFWFRRDLRLHDNAGLFQALKQSRWVYCVFIFDTAILGELLTGRARPVKHRRVEFIWRSLAELDHALHQRGGALICKHGAARTVIPQLAAQLGVDAVFTNHDYEPQALLRDDAVRGALQLSGVQFHSCKDQSIFEKDEILTLTGKAYSVFTPYKKAWLKALTPVHLKSYAIENYAARLRAPAQPEPLPSLESMGFAPTNLSQLQLKPGASGARELWDDFRARIDAYHERRDYPGIKGVSYLSVHQRFGTISIRELARFAHEHGSDGAQTWLSELIWRDFYFQILFHFPHVVDRAFRPEFERLEFDNREDWFDAWCRGVTGFPIIDAAMRQLNQTGYMHNRLRMITASFLVKDLLIDWRWGERYFAEQLNDFDLAANNGGWQWAASTGCDAQPYFRIFNPVSQSQRFDPDGRFIRRYLPELVRCSNAQIHEPSRMSTAEQAAAGVRIGSDYPKPIVQHETQRKLALARYAEVNKFFKNK